MNSKNASKAKEPVVGKGFHLQGNTSTVVSEVRISSSLEQLDVTDTTKGVVVTLQYQDSGKWVDHLTISFQGGPIPETVNSFGGDPTAIIATTQDVASLRGKPIRIQSDVRKSLNASFDIEWL